MGQPLNFVNLLKGTNMKRFLTLAFAFPMILMAPADAGAGGAAAKEAKPKAEPKPKQPSQNGVTRPAPGTKTAAVWDLADSISAEKQRPALREEVMAAGEANGLNRGTIATQYARWTEYFGVSKEARAAARDAAKPAKPEAEPAAAPTPAA